MINLFSIFASEEGKQLLFGLYVAIFLFLCGKMPQGCGGCGSWLNMRIRTTVSCQMGNRSFRLQVVSPTRRFAYKAIRLHRGRFAYTTEVVSPHYPSRFAYIEVDSPTMNTYS